MSSGQANALSDRATFRGVNQAATVDGGVSMSLDVQFDGAVEWFTMGFTDSGADANCGTCDSNVEALCGASTWFEFSIDRQNNQVVAWLEQNGNQVSMSPLATLPIDNVASTIEVQFEPRAICSSSSLDSGSFPFDTGN